jgi:hypothetical protein
MLARLGCNFTATLILNHPNQTFLYEAMVMYLVNTRLSTVGVQFRSHPSHSTAVIYISFLIGNFN